VQFGLLISVLLHVALLGGAFFSIHSRQDLRLAETEPVAVGMITPGEATKVKQGVRTAKLLEAAEAKESPKGDQAKKEAKQPKMAATAPPPPPPSATPEEKKAPPAPPKVADPPAPAPPPAAAEEAKKKLADEQRLVEEKKRAEEQEKADALQRAEAQKVAEEKKRLEEEQKQADERKRAEELKKRQDEERRLKLARERKERQRKAAEAAKKRKLEEEKALREAEASKAKQFDADKIAALLNKVPDKSAPPPPSEAGDQPTKNKGPTLGAAEGKDKKLSISQIGMIQQAIKSCVKLHWNVLSGGASAQETVVKIRIRLNPDGTLSTPPEIKPPPGTPTPYFRAISESALRAVQECEPYDLPPDLYDHWKDLLVSFSPTDMY
jgi:colicin import membrane protein